MGSLSNLKVLDFSTLLPGPFATMMLADMGAEVLRIESPARPDLTRELPPFLDGVSSKHATLNRNKRAITLDLKNSHAVELVKKMLAEYDILIEQFRPGVMDRLGLGYEQLKQVNPSLIYCAITGYGQTGPYRDRAGHDNNYLSVSGVNGYSGRPGELPPIMGTQVADIACGSLHGVVGILAAVNHRHITGDGQYVDISMTDAAFSLNVMFGSDYLAAGIEPAAGKEVINGGSFYDYYETSDGRYLSVGSLEPQFFERLCMTLGGMQLLNQGVRQDPASQRVFKQTLQRIFKSKTLEHWRSVFADKDACVEPVLKFSEAASNPQIRQREMVVAVPHSNGSMIDQIAHPIKMSRCEPRYQFTGVKLGEHNSQILDELEITDTLRQALIESKAMG
jgi:crotonobetainyl-CoA:carnitine CoA-transferase CaiB-like acyl-CoA transferase